MERTPIHLFSGSPFKHFHIYVVSDRYHNFTVLQLQQSHDHFLKGSEQGRVVKMNEFMLMGQSLMQQKIEKCAVKECSEICIDF